MSDAIFSDRVTTAGALRATNNLSEVASSSTARNNLGLQSGMSALVSGTKTITATITANSRIFAFIKDPNPGLGGLTVLLSAPASSRSIGGSTFAIQANIAAGTINVLDTSTFDWIVVG